MIEAKIHSENDSAFSWRIFAIYFFGSLLTRPLEKNGWVSFPTRIALLGTVALLIDYWWPASSTNKNRNGFGRLLVKLALSWLCLVIIPKILSGLLAASLIYGIMTFVWLILINLTDSDNSKITVLESGKQLLIAILVGVIIHFMQ